MIFYIVLKYCIKGTSTRLQSLKIEFNIGVDMHHWHAIEPSFTVNTMFIAQRGAVITRVILSKIFTKDIP